MAKEEQEKFTCSKCGKEKGKEEGKFNEIGGKVFCCDLCCGSEKEKPQICEFC